LNIDEVWHGDDIEQNWDRCHAMMKRVGRDGRKLELWKRWLEPYITMREVDVDGKGKNKQTSETSAHGSGASPALGHITAILRIHVRSLPCIPQDPTYSSFIVRAMTFSTRSYSLIPEHSSLPSWVVQDCCQN